MKKYLLVCSFALAFYGCEEANDIYGYPDPDDYVSTYTEIIVNEDGYDRAYSGPVYVSASNWGSVAYISETYVNKGIKLLISETNDAEGGKEYDVTSSTIVINDLSPNRQYYYCLYIPNGGIKSEIKSVVIPDVSTLDMTIVCENDSVICTIQDSISTALIVEKGFSVDAYGGVEDRKYVVTGNRFACSINDVFEKLSEDENNNSLPVYAYVQTANTYYYTRDIDVIRDKSLSSTDNKINTDDIVFSAISEKTENNIDYLVCTVTGYVDEAYFCQNWDHSLENAIYADKVEKSDDGKTTTFYVKKGFYTNIQLYASYKKYYYEDNYWDESSYSEVYYPTSYNIRSLDDLIGYSQLEEVWSELTINLLNDITIPSDMRLCIQLPNGIFNGNDHVIDGVSYFPLFRHNSGEVTIKNLKIGTDDAVYHVKKGTNSLSTTNNEVPNYLLLNSRYYVYFENSEIRGTIEVTGSNDFRITNEYNSNGFEEKTGKEVIAGLKDYTITKYNN